MRPANKFTRFYDFLANLGLVIRDDPPKVIDLSARAWGAAEGGLSLSVAELPREGSRGVTGISVVMRNEAGEPKRFTAPPLARFYRIEGLEPTAYGRQLLHTSQNQPQSEISLSPGGVINTDLPLATTYNVRAAGEYKIQVTCTLADGTVLRSNELTICV